MKKKIIIIGAIVIALAVAVSVYFLCCRNPKMTKEANEEKDTLVAPLAGATGYITEEADNSLTVEGMICTPVNNEDAPIMDVDDPDYDPDAVIEYQMQMNVFDNYKYEIKDGSGYLKINYTMSYDDENASPTFKVVLDEEQIKDIDDLYIVCDDVTTRVWEK